MDNLLLLSIAIISLIAVIGFPEAAAENGREGGGAAALGWAAVGTGILGTGSLVVYKMSKRALLATVGSGGITRPLTMMYKPVLNFHIAMNLIGYSAGMSHGIILSSAADGISISLALVMTVLVASGVLMRFTTSRTRIFNTQVHGQVLLVILVIVLVLLHIATAND